MICKHYKMSHVVYVSQMAMIHSSMGMVVRRALSVSAPQLLPRYNHGGPATNSTAVCLSLLFRFSCSTFICLRIPL